MLFTLEVLRAQEGDCLILHWSDGGDPKFAVIDGGPGRVYEEFLRPRLLEIREHLQAERLDLELVMVSHVDADHIVGVKKLFAGLRNEFDKKLQKKALRVKRLWHNTFNDMLGDGLDDYYKSFTSAFTASVGGSPNPKIVEGIEHELKAKKLPEKEARERAYDISMVIAGHADARVLRDDHKYLYSAQQIGPVNAASKAKKSTLITSKLAEKAITLEGLKFKVIGPEEEEIVALQKDFDKFIKKKGLTAEAVLAAYSDDSIPNLSSIVCLVEMGGRTILLTGDARGDKMLASLKKQGHLKKGKLKVDVFKAPHHGSIRNASKDLFDAIVADTYIFSGNGKHGNPDRETLELLFNSRDKKEKYEIVLTYPVDETDQGRKEDFESEASRHGKAVKWSAAKQSLKALFDQKKTEGHQFTLRAGAPILIELGDEKVKW
jgi:hypothetical protein